MGTPEQDLASVLGQRETSLVAVGDTKTRAPWGPALTALLDQALNEEIEPLETRVVSRPDTVPMPSRAMFGPHTPAPASGFPDEAGRATADQVGAPEVDDLAETTRQQLTRMYDARVAAPALVDSDASASAPRTDPAPARPARRRATTSRVERTPHPGRRKLLLGVVLLVVAVLAVRYVRHALAGDDAAVVNDPTTAVDKLPWRTVRYGDVLVQLPTHASSATLSDASGSSYRYDRYVLPDLTLTVTMHAAEPSLHSDAALRSYTTSLAGQLGGRLLLGASSDVTFGTAFSANLDLPEGQAQMYVLSTRDALIEVQAELRDEETGRAAKIYERVIRSFTPA
jgi:hypothetical protein